MKVLLNGLVFLEQRFELFLALPLRLLLRFSDDAMEQIAEEAIVRNVGAGGATGTAGEPATARNSQLCQAEASPV